MNGGPKKWFMLQVWRVQQVAQIITLVLLMFTTAGLLYDYMDPYQTGPLEQAWIGVPMIILMLGLIVWMVAIIWDMRFRMWREQMTVLTERNPYAKEKMNAKEVALYRYFWLPMAESLSKADPKMKDSAEFLRAWLDRVQRQDNILNSDVEDIKKELGQK
jgi:uncharacterized membrane protein